MTESPARKLIEVALPLDAINAACIREKSLRHGHPSTLHLYWARRPLAAMRAVLFAQLVDDPSAHPDRFPTEVAQQAERARLFKIIEALVKWENSTNESVLAEARAEIQRCCPDLPTICDPFSGGGSTALEAQRLGLPSQASDLNPVSVVIGKAMVEIPARFADRPPVHPGTRGRAFYRHAEGLAEDVAYYGQWMREQAFQKIGHLYPKVTLPDGGGPANVIAWIWARTVPSPDPAFSACAVPLVTSFLLSAKKGREAWINPVVDKSAKTIHYDIRHGGTAGELEEARKGTSAGPRQGFRCIFTGAAMPYDHIRACGKAGRMGQTLMAIVAEGKHGRVYLPPNADHESAAQAAQPAWQPEISFNPNALGFRTAAYGLETFGDLFTPRQLTALTTFSDLLPAVRSKVESDASHLPDDPRMLRDGGSGATAYAEAVSVYLAFAIDRGADHWSSICTWFSSSESGGHTFGRQAIPMSWDFAEKNPFSNSAATWDKAKDGIAKTITAFRPNASAQITQQDAQTIHIPQNTIIVTDPPYYDNIGYADLSDFFYAWMKRNLKGIYPDMFHTLSTPKAEELVATPFRHGGKDAAGEFFMGGMKQTLKNMAAQHSPDLPATIFYAFKQQEMRKDGLQATGWSTFLQAVIDAGWTITGTWPLRTELANRMRGQNSNALSSSVVLACRKRPANAPVMNRMEFVRKLQKELPPALTLLQSANTTPADLPQCAIGPAMALFTRAAAVINADDTKVDAKVALQLINVELDAFLNDIQTEFDRETRFAISWYELHGHAPGPFGQADPLARTRDTSISNLHRTGVAVAREGKVRLPPPEEYKTAPNPATAPVWSCLMHLLHLYDQNSVTDPTIFYAKALGGKLDAAKDLAYVLYEIANTRRNSPAEAFLHNALVTDYRELTDQVAIADPDAKTRQGKMDV